MPVEFATKTFVNDRGVAVRHASIAKNWSTDPDRDCQEVLEFRGWPGVREDGSSTVEWFGSFHHREVYCPVHGALTTVLTVAPRSRGEDEKPLPVDPITEF